MSYFQDGWEGSHDFKFGYDWKRDRRNFFQDQPFDIFYRDLNSAVDAGRHLQLADLADQRCRLQRRLDQRHVEVQRPPDAQPRAAVRALRDGWPEQEFTPNGHPQLANWPADVNPVERARTSRFIAPQTVAARDGRRHQDVRRRASASPTT